MPSESWSTIAAKRRKAGTTPRGMTLQPTLQAAPVIQLHSMYALVALMVGTIQLAAAKGTRMRRRVGWVWVVLLGTFALTSFGIRALRLGSYSLVHVISAVTLVAGTFTLLPSRIMEREVF